MGDHLRLVLLLVSICVFVFVLDRSGALLGAERFLTEARMKSFSRDATGEVVFVAIDQRSIREVAVWPWPREIHADLVRSLLKLGAREVYFDIDFSTPSNSVSDAQLAEAFSEASGKVILPVFKQAEGTGKHANNLVESLPLELFLNDVWLASTNVQTSADGRLWRYPFGQRTIGGQVGSAGAVIAGKFGPPAADFAVDYTINPSSVPTFSAIDVLEGVLDPASIKGRSVVVGAHAEELRDYIPVPVHGVIPWPILHILAAETLLAGTALKPLSNELALSVVTLIIVLLSFSRVTRQPTAIAGAVVLIAGAIEIIAFILQIHFSISLSTPIVHAFLLSVFGASLVRELGLQRWLIQRFRTEARNNRSVFQHVVKDSSDAIIFVEQSGDIIEMNERARKLFAPEIRMDHYLKSNEIFPVELCELTRASMASPCDENATRNASLCVFRDGAKPIYLECSVTVSRLERHGQNARSEMHQTVACVTVRDVTVAHQQRMALERLAKFDSLTGALNRTEFARRLNEALSKAKHAVFAINLHRFKTINTTLGRSIGDQVLCAVAQRLEQVVPNKTGIGRLGGDVFVVACPASDRERAEVISDAVIASVEEPFEVDGAKVNIGARVGVALSRDGMEATDVVSQSELALDVAREMSGQGTCFYDRAASYKQERSRLIERALWTAIPNNEFYIAYQPQVELTGSRLVGAEALIRWRHPALGDVSPSEFIPVAENIGFIEKLGRWVLRKACKDARTWPTPVPVAVNISPIQLRNGNTLPEVRAALLESKLPAAQLYLEITESTLIEKSDGLMQTLHQLHEMGVRLALDDFGSGFSSFGYLANLPIDKLKLDRMFAPNSSQDDPTLAIVASVVTLCRELGLESLCEGVETEDQRRRLSDLGCQQAQGFHFCHPLILSDLLNWFQRNPERQFS